MSVLFLKKKSLLCRDFSFSSLPPPPPLPRVDWKPHTILLRRKQFRLYTQVLKTHHRALKVSDDSISSEGPVSGYRSFLGQSPEVQESKQPSCQRARTSAHTPCRISSSLCSSGNSELSFEVTSKERQLMCDKPEGLPGLGSD